MVSGIVDLAVGLGTLATGSASLAWWADRDSVPIGLAVSIVGLIFLLNGAGRVTARVEIAGPVLTWTWGLSRHSIVLADLEDAALVEKGSPAAGGSWAGYLGGGLLSVVVWSLVSLAGAFVRSGPSLGPVDLVLIKHHGAPLEIKAISAWSTSHSHSQANEALRAVQSAISASEHRAWRNPGILQHDAWEG